MSSHDKQALALADVPAVDAPYSEIVAFALSFNGYAHCGSLSACADLAEHGPLDSVEALRSALFFEQRSSRFTIPGCQVINADGAPGAVYVDTNDAPERQMRSLVARIRDMLSNSTD